MTSHGDRAAEARRTGLPDCGRDVSGRFVVKAVLRFGSAGTAQRISLPLPMVPSFRHVIHRPYAGRHSSMIPVAYIPVVRRHRGRQGHMQSGPQSPR